MPINPLGSGNLFSMFGSHNDTSRQVVTVLFPDKHAGVELEADALLSSLGFKTADLKAYRQTYGVDLRDKMIDGLRNQPINYNVGHRVYDSESKSYKFQTTIGMDKALYSQLKAFIVERHSAQSQDVAGASDKVGALNAMANARKQQVLAQLPPLQVNVAASTAAIPLDTPLLPALPTAREIGTKLAETGTRVAEAVPPVAMMAAEAATPVLIGSHLAQKYVEGKQTFEMQQANAVYEALEAQDAAKLPPFGNNEPLAPSPPPLINPNQSEQGRKLTQPITSPLAPPNVAMTTPPLANNQPLPPTPPLVNPIQEQRARDLLIEARMSKQLGDNMAAAGIPRPANTAAHHIVAWNSPNADAARLVLDRFGIDINSAANGVFLPQKAASVAPGMYHPTLHTQKYYDAVDSLLNDVTTKEEALDALKSIRTLLQNGTFPR